MQLALTLALLAATSSAIQKSYGDDCTITYEHNNCGRFDEWEDCREDAALGATEDEFIKCIDDIEEQFWEECGGDDALDYDCYESHMDRYLEVLLDYDCLKDDSCLCPIE